MPESKRILNIRRPTNIYVITSLSLAILLLYFSFRGLHWRTIWDVIRQAKPVGLGIDVGILSLNLMIRSVRWRVLLLAEDWISIRTTFWANAAGYLGNSILPARAGELIRVVLISSSSGMSRAFVLATALSERIADALTLILISITVLFLLPARPEWVTGLEIPVVTISAVGLLILLSVPALESRWLRFLAVLPISDNAKDRARNALIGILRGIRTFHQSRRLILFFSLTLLIWLLDATAAIVLAQSINLALTIPLALLLLAALGLGSALPSTPGYIGIYQFATIAVLVPFGFSRSDAIAYIILFQALGYLVISVWGLAGISQSRAKNGNLPFAAAK